MVIVSVLYYILKNNIFAISDLKTLRINEIDNRSINFTGEGKITDVKVFLNYCEFYKKEIAFYCDYDKIIGRISIRQRAEGDSITPHKKNRYQ